MCDTEYTIPDEPDKDDDQVKPDDPKEDKKDKASIKLVC